MSAGRKIIEGLQAAVAGDFSRVTIEGQVWQRVDTAPPQCAREAIARKMADWIGTSWDGLSKYSTVDAGFPEWRPTVVYHGGKPDLLRLADALMAHTRPDSALEESVKLQSHYAELLNMHDGGKRRTFANAQEWIDRLSAVTRPESETP